MNPQIPPVPTQPIKFPQPNKTLKVAVAVLGVLFVIALAFGLWAFSSRGTIKTNADKELATASSELTKARAAQTAADAAIKAPYKTFTGPATYGSISFKYPKNWSAYADETDSTNPVEGYFYPDVVPSIQGSTAFALRVELVGDDYSSVIQQFQSSIDDGSLKASAYIPPKMKGVANAQTGMMLSGAISQNSDGTSQNGTMVVLKVRDKTLQVYTESQSYLNDFDKIVLANLSYKP